MKILPIIKLEVSNNLPFKIGSSLIALAHLKIQCAYMGSILNYIWLTEYFENFLGIKKTSGII